MSDRDEHQGGAPDDYSWLFSDDAPVRDRQSGRSPLGPPGRTPPPAQHDDPASARTQAIPRTPGGPPPAGRLPVPPAGAADAGAAATQMLPTTPSTPRPAAAPPSSVRPSVPAGSNGSPPPGAPPGSRPGGFPPPPSPPRGRHRGRLVRRIVILVLVALLAFFVVTPVWAWNQIDRVRAEQPTADTSGTNILVVGSDKRSDLSAAERKKLGTGNAAGQRTDSIMLLHLPAKGEPTLVSLPRDSYVPIPGHSRNKINAAFAFGGPTLLVKTVEAATGLHVDGYVEVGFGGFVNVVDSVGGVNMCLTKAMKDKDAHVDLKAGCQLLDGTQALGFVRARHSQAKGDLDRVDHQRQLLAAITKKAISPVTLLPWRYYGLLGAGAKSVSIGKDTSLREMIGFARGMRAVSSGKGVTTTVPIANASYSTSAGSAVLWDHDKALAFFSKLKDN